MTASTLDFGFVEFQAERRTASQVRCSSVGTVGVNCQPWLWPVALELEELRQLPRGWDSYRAAPLKPHVIKTVFDVLDGVMLENTPIPAVVPLKSGGVQLEWHEKGIDLEIQIRSQMDVRVCFEDLNTGDTFERSIGANLAHLRQPIRKLSQR